MRSGMRRNHQGSSLWGHTCSWASQWDSKPSFCLLSFDTWMLGVYMCLLRIKPRWQNPDHVQTNEASYWWTIKIISENPESKMKYNKRYDERNKKNHVKRQNGQQKVYVSYSYSDNFRKIFPYIWLTGYRTWWRVDVSVDQKEYCARTIVRLENKTQIDRSKGHQLLYIKKAF